MIFKTVTKMPLSDFFAVRRGISYS